MSQEERLTGGAAMTEHLAMTKDRLKELVREGRGTIPRALKAVQRLAAPALCLLSLSSCSDFSSQSSSWWLRYHPEEDEAVFVEVMDGVTAKASAAGPLRELAKGWRRYPPEGGLITFDLDEELDANDIPEGVNAERAQAILASLRREVVVSEAGLFRVGAEGLGFYRVTEIKDLSVFLSDLNELFNIALEEEWREGGVDISWEDFEPGEETKARWMKRAREREPWLTRTGATFTLDVPMTEREAAGFLRAALADAEDFPAEAWFMKALVGVRLADGSLTLSFSPKSQRFEGASGGGGGGRNEEHTALFKALGDDPGFIDLDRSKLLERVK